MATLWDNKEGGVGSENETGKSLSELLDQDIAHIRDLVVGTVKGKTTQVLGAAGDIGELADDAILALTGIDVRSQRDVGFPTSKEVEQAIGVYNPNPSTAEQVGSMLDPAHLIKAGLAGALKGIVVPRRVGGLGNTLLHPSTHIGEDKWLRTEISDADAKWKPADIVQFLKDHGMFGSDMKVGDVLDHPELYAAAPEAADIPFNVVLPMNAYYYGDFTPETGKIRLNPYSLNPTTFGKNPIPDDEAMLSTLMHEIQHWVQDKSSYIPGGNPEQFNIVDKDTWTAMKKEAGDEFEKVVDKARTVIGRNPEFMSKKQLADVEKSHPDVMREFYAAELRNETLKHTDQKFFRQYQALGGEVESRVVQQRLKLTQDEADNYPFEQHYADEKLKSLQQVHESMDMLKKIRESAILKGTQP